MAAVPPFDAVPQGAEASSRRVWLPAFHTEDLFGVVTLLQGGSADAAGLVAVLVLVLASRADHGRAAPWLVGRRGLWDLADSHAG